MVLSLTNTMKQWQYGTVIDQYDEAMTWYNLNTMKTDTKHIISSVIQSNFIYVKKQTSFLVR